MNHSICSNFKGMKVGDASMLTNMSVPNQIYLYKQGDIIKKITTSGNGVYKNDHVYPFGTHSKNK